MSTVQQIFSIHKHFCNAPVSISYNVSPLHSITSPAILYTHNFNIPWWAKFSALTYFQMHSNVQKLNTPNIVNNDQLIIICLFVQIFLQKFTHENFWMWLFSNYSTQSTKLHTAWVQQSYSTCSYQWLQPLTCPPLTICLSATTSATSPPHSLESGQTALARSWSNTATVFLLHQQETGANRQDSVIG